MPAAISNSTEELLQYRSARALAKCLCGHVSANAVTTINIFASAIVVYAVYIKSLPMAVGAYAFRMFLDDLDGTVARQCGERSTFGHCYEHIVDMLMCIGAAGAFGYTYFGPRTAAVVVVASSALAVVLHYFMFATGKTKDDNDASTMTKISNFVLDDNTTIFGLLALTVLMLALPYVQTAAD